MRKLPPPFLKFCFLAQAVPLLFCNKGVACLYNKYIIILVFCITEYEPKAKFISFYLYRKEIRVLSCAQKNIIVYIIYIYIEKKKMSKQPLPNFPTRKQLQYLPPLHLSTIVGI